MRNSPIYRFPALLCASLAFAVTAFSFAAPPKSAPPPPPQDQLKNENPSAPHTTTTALPTPDKSPLTLSAQSTPFDPLGLSINLPDWANVTQEPTPGGDTITVAVRDSAKDPVWSMRIQSVKNNLQNPNAKEQMDRVLTELRAGQEFQVLQNDPVKIAGVNSQLCYVKHSGETGQSFVSGWLIIPREEQNYIVFTIATTPDVFPKLKTLLDSSFATIHLTTPNDISSERRVRVEAGQLFLKSLSPKDLKQLVGLKQIARSYVPGKGSNGKDVERGYSLIEVTESSRTVFSSTADETPGLLLTIRGRTVQDPERRVYIDSLAQYWVSWDLAEEQWSVTATRRQGEAWVSQAETGVLPPKTTGEPTPTLTIVISETAARTNEPFQWPVPDTYMPQAIGWVIGRLLPRDSTSPLEFKWYYYSSASGKPSLALRTDVWKPLENSKGMWELTTQLSAATQTFTSTYDSAGNLVRRTYADGSLTEPATVEDITKRWRAQGLEVGKSK